MTSPIRQRQILRDHMTANDRMHRHDSDEQIAEEAVKGLARGLLTVIAALPILWIGLYFSANHVINGGIMEAWEQNLRDDMKKAGITEFPDELTAMYYKLGFIAGMQHYADDTIKTLDGIFGKERA